MSITVSLNAHKRLQLFVLHRHGLKQFRNGWADGPAYITQCPAHQNWAQLHLQFSSHGSARNPMVACTHLWLRATVYGAIVIMPKEGTPFPFPQPYSEANIVLGRW